MKSLQEILNSGESAWFYILTREGKAAFLKEARECGCIWINGEEIGTDPDVIGSRMGLSPSKTIGYVSAMCWCFPAQNKPVKYRYPSFEIIDENNDVIKYVETMII